MVEKESSKKGRGCAYRACLVWSGIGAIILLLLVAFVFYGSFRSAQNRVQAELKRVQEAGEPIDDASKTDWFRSQTHSEGTQAWLWSYPLGNKSSKVPTARPEQNSESGIREQIYRIR